VLQSPAMALRSCTVGFKAATGISHSVEVEASSVLEAAALGLARLKKDGWIEGLGPATRLEITARDPATSHHTVTVQKVQTWLESSSPAPADALVKARARRLLGR
jgi:hypothetical protein